MLSRRHFFFGSLALPALAAKKTPVERPNLVLLVADRLPAWVLGIHGNKEFRTPNLDRLAQTGTRFIHHYTAAPMPQQGLSTLLTGRTPMQLGASGTVRPGDATLEQLLRSAGFNCQTALANTPEAAVEGVQFLDQQQAGKPFALTIHIAGLAQPYAGVPAKYREMYAQAKFETVGFESAAQNARLGREMLSDPVAGLRAFAADVTRLDDAMGALIARLTQRRLLDNTLVVFTSTCGTLAGRHGLWDAGEASEPVNMFEEAVNTPLIWSWLGHAPAQISRPEMVSSYDLLPSLCDALGATAPQQNLCGRSYLLLATGKPLPKKEAWPATVFAQCGDTAMAREDRYKLVERQGGKGPGEIYDLSADPREKVNQFDNPQFASVRQTLAAALSIWRQRYSS
jgi:arylsulfatase A-like enzyme